MTSVVLVLESTVDDMIAADLFGIFTLDQIAQLFFFDDISWSALILLDNLSRQDTYRLS